MPECASWQTEDVSGYAAVLTLVVRRSHRLIGGGELWAWTVQPASQVLDR